MNTTDTASGKRFLGINLAPGTGDFNMVTFYLACLTGILLSTFVPRMQPYLLRVPQYPEVTAGC